MFEKAEIEKVRGEKHLARAAYEMYGDKASKVLGLSEGTLRKWLEETDDEVSRSLHEEQKRKFVERAWKVIGQALTLLEKQLPGASAREIASIIGTLVDRIITLQRAEMKLSESKELTISNISDEQLTNLIEELILNGKRSSSPSETLDVDPDHTIVD